MESIYNYRKDPDILKVAQWYDKNHSGKTYTELLKNHTPVSLVPYDLHAISLRNPDLLGGTYAERDTLSESVRDYVNVVIQFFKKHKSLEWSELTDKELSLSGLNKELFDEYVSKLQEGTGRDFDKVLKYSQMWVVITTEILMDVYEAFNFTLDAFDKPEYTLDLYHCTRACIDTMYEDFVENLGYGPFVDASHVILYNFWGDEYGFKVNQIRQDVSPNAEEQQMLDMFFNKNKFRKEYCALLRKAIAECPDSSHKNEYVHESERFLQDMLSEYTKLLRRKSIVRRDTIIFAVQHWYYSTCNMIRREEYLMVQECRLSTYEPGSEVHPNVFRTTALGKERIELLERFRVSGENMVGSLCNEFRRKLENGELIYEWAGDLEQLKIPYGKLYMKMNGVFFSGIDEATFADCIKSADLSPIQNHLISPDRNMSALKFLVQRIGKQVDSWYFAAAASLKNTKGESYSKNDIQRQSHPREASCELDEILDELLSLPKKGKKK